MRTMKMGGGGVAPHIRNFGTKCRYVISQVHDPAVPPRRETWWAP